MTELALLFSSAFLAATLFPAQSELVLISLHATGRYSPATLLIVASLGNILGSVMNWLLGRYLLHFSDRKWFPIKKPTLDKATTLYQKYGIWTLLFAWLPFIGDPLTLVAGMLRTHILLFILLVTIGKVGRYTLLLAAL